MTEWVNTILELAASIYWVTGIFIFFTILLHILFVFLFPLGLRAWKLADYIWLMLAFLSTLALVGEAKQFRAEKTHRQSEWVTTQSLGEVRSWYVNYQIYICDEAKNLKTRNLLDTDYHDLCNWLEGRINDLNLLQIGGPEYPVLTLSLTEGLSRFTAILPPIEQKILRKRIARYSGKRQQYLENNRERRRSTLQRIMLILAPVMFAMALAIRVTKVTAEYRLLKSEGQRF